MNESEQSSGLECFYCGGALPHLIMSNTCPHCGKCIDVIRIIPDPKTQCGNCHAGLEPEDRYCRVCGTKRGEGAYDPYTKMLDEAIIYGPMPVERTHTCKKCGYSWVTCQMIDNERFCPMCGGEVHVYSIGDDTI